MRIGGWVGGLDDRSAVFGIRIGVGGGGGGGCGDGGGSGGGGSSGGVVWNTRRRRRRRTLTHPSPSRMVHIIGRSRRVLHTADARVRQFGTRQKRIALAPAL